MRFLQVLLLLSLAWIATCRARPLVSIEPSEITFWQGYRNCTSILNTNNALAKAQAFYKLGMYDSAIRSARQAIAEKPDTDAQIVLGLSLLKIDKREEAQLALQIALDERPIDTTAISALAELSMRELDTESARSLARKALEIDPNCVNALAIDSLTNISLDPEHAAASAFKAIDIDPQNAAGHRAAAWYCNQQRDFGAMLACAERAVKLDPNDSENQFTLATALSSSGAYEQARQAASCAIALSPKHSKYYLCRAHDQIDLVHFEEALKDCRKAREVNPNSALSFYQEARAWIGFQSFDKVIPLYDEAIKHIDAPKGLSPNANKALTEAEMRIMKAYAIRAQPEKEEQGTKAKLGEEELNRAQGLTAPLRCDPIWGAQAHFLDGLAMLARGNAPDAITHFAAASRLKPRWPHPHLLQATAYQAISKMKEARREAEIACLLAPQSSAALGKLSLGQLTMGEPALASKTALKAIKLNDRQSDAWATLAFCGQQNAAEGRAQNYISDPSILFAERAIALAPLNPAGHMAMAWLQLNNKHPWSTVQSATNALALIPTLADGYAVRGLAYFRLKQYPKALEDLNKAVSLSPTDARYYLYLAKTYNATGARKQAIANADKAIKLDADLEEAYKERD